MWVGVWARLVCVCACVCVGGWVGGCGRVWVGGCACVRACVRACVCQGPCVSMCLRYGHVNVYQAGGEDALEIFLEAQLRFEASCLFLNMARVLRHILLRGRVVLYEG